MNLNKKALLIVGAICILVIVILIVALGYYHTQQKKLDDMAHFDQLKKSLKEESKLVEADNMKSRKFIEDHFPYELHFLEVEQEVNTSATGEEIALYYLEQSLLNDDVETWLSYFSPLASEQMMNELTEGTLEGRMDEIVGYMREITRGEKFIGLSNFKSEDKIYAVFKYSDGLEIEIPLEFKRMDDKDVLINTDILVLIDKIKSGSSQ